MQSSRSHDRFALWLVAYFRSGWAFLIPYLAAYLLYAKLQWPVDLSAGNATGGSPSLFPLAGSLLHLYWFLHGLHLILGALALRAWLTNASVPRSPLSLFQNAAPWFCLALLFWIPGVYLEFPADPWEHYARINQWREQLDVTGNPIWSKSSYFFAYSFIGRITSPVPQLRWFDLYYTGCCILLCWQYYRLARAVGLGERASFVFVLLQALTLGNNIFGFYRYYGMSSTVFSQIGAVAVVRIAMEALQSHEKHGLWSAGSFTRSRPGKELDLQSGFLAPAGMCIALLPLIAFNHVQGLGIAGLGLAAVVVWRLIGWRRSMLGWLVLVATLTSVAVVLGWPRHPAIQEVYRAENWFTPWYGFNVLSPTSPAFGRVVDIFGIFGGLNFVLGLFLIRRNHVAGWLTIMPTLALSFPFVAIPLANAIAGSEHGAGYITTFHRLLLATPSGLALVVFASKLHTTKIRWASSVFQTAARKTAASGGARFAIIFPFTLLFLTVVPANGVFHNRLWHAFARPPSDLQWRHLISATDNPFLNPTTGSSPGQVLTTPGVGYILGATGAEHVIFKNKGMAYPNATDPATRLDTLLHRVVEARDFDVQTYLLIPSTVSQFTPSSHAGYLSGHWLPQQVAFDYAGESEIAEVAHSLPGTSTLKASPVVTWYKLGQRPVQRSSPK